MVKMLEKIKKKRDVNYELIRVLAMVMVIMEHHIEKFVYTTENQWFYNLLDAFFTLSMPLFFYLAGRFAFKLNLEDKTLYKKFYWKKMIGLIIPVLIYMAIKNWHVMWYHQGLAITPRSYLEHFGIALVNGFNFMEYWFLYVLIGCMIAVPFTARMVQNMKEKDKKAFLIVGLIMCALTCYIPLFKVDFMVHYYFIGHVLSFYLGFMLEDIFADKKLKKLLYIAAPICFAINMAIIYAGFTNGYKETSPFYMIAAMGLFIFLREKLKAPKNLEKPILFLGKHSLGVYMLHMMVMYSIGEVIELPFGFIGFFIASILCLIGSVALAFIIDNTLIRWAQKLCIKIFKLESVLK